MTGESHKKATFAVDKHVSGTSPLGTTCKVVYTEREMTVYGIEEEELESIGDAHHNFTLWWAIASASFAVLAGCLWDMVNLPDTSAIKLNAIGFSVLCGAIGAGAIFFATRYKTMKDERIKRIKERSRLVEH